MRQTRRGARLSRRIRQPASPNNDYIAISSGKLTGLLGHSMASLTQTFYSRLMDALFRILIPLSLLAVTATLFVGLFALFRGGEFGRSNSNKLMRLRVALQAVAVVVLVAAYWWRSH